MSPDFLVIGAGVAGLRAAIELAQAGRVLVVAKDSLRESASEYAQGGIAVALSDEDEIALHEQDTVDAGDGLCFRPAVHTLVDEGPAAIQQLIAWGAAFDREHGSLAFTREGAHSRNRILHAQGDSTGHEIVRTLYRQAASLPNITFQSFDATLDLLLHDGVCGASLWDGKSHRRHAVQARAVLLATGGLGNVFRNTTNPEVATGDGVAMAYRAGAEICDLEFVQFHPTALHVDGAPPFLISEALRGEGAILRNAAGDRFMDRYHPLKDLAPRDVVARAIVAEMQRSGAGSVTLDLTHREPGFARGRFPRIYETCMSFGVDIERQPIPVAPAAHYAMGGVHTDLDGRTNIPRLYAAGEAACTGVHGANRLASNSLLEGVVFGARAGRSMREWASRPLPAEGIAPDSCGTTATAPEIRELAWDKCGIMRDAEGLESACRWLASSERPGRATPPEAAAVRNMHQVAMLIARCALARKESRGAHFRSDFAHKEVAFEKHSVACKNDEIRFR